MMESARSSRSSSPAEERFIIENWIPEPLVPDVDAEENKRLLNPLIVTSKPGKFITVDGRQCLNCGTHNYLGLADDPRLEKASIMAARKYGVGSCGPRAFYGTMDIHLDLEEALANFLNVQEAVLYSYGFSTIASAIPAYAKSTDVVFFDEQCNFSIQRGILASKSKAIKFRHNDVTDLDRKINDFNQEYEKKHGKKKPIRAFLLVESIYALTGDICLLKELVEVAKQYRLRVFIDESRSFGVLGKTGKGITEHLGIDIQEVDLIMASLENALCGYGGFCAGSKYVIDHQRLAGTGYCFSASLPPLQCQVALETLKIIRDNPNLVIRAQELFEYAHNKLEGLRYLKNIAHPLSPLKILVPQRASGQIWTKDDEHKLELVCEHILQEDSIAMSLSRFLVDDEMTSPITSIKLIISACLTHVDIDRIFVSLNKYSFFT